MDPFQILAQVLPRARSEEELIEMAAALGEPPSLTGMPPASVTPSAGARLQGMKQSPLAPSGEQLVPPMTAGESRTAPRIGQTLLGV